MISALRFGAAWVVVAATAVGANAQETPEARRATTPMISVVGHGKVAAMPDVADITVGVVSQGPTAKEALRLNSEAMIQLTKVLKERGIAEKDIETKQIQVSPVYTQPGARQPTTEEFVPKVAGYRVTNSVEITERTIAKLGDLLDAVVQAGANQIYGISFRVEKTEQLLDQARKLAMIDARRKAKLLATEAAVEIGAAYQIVESGGGAPRPGAYGGMAYPTMAARSAAPVAAGEQELAVSIQVSYMIVGLKN